ncbi:MAG: hypothetical protein JNM99_22685 [Verrucomicrobiaceae bacterium]|nr:hypothetical protein [Verrucomicrobiaceae bacterium]
MSLPSLRSLTSLYTLDRPFARIANVTGIVLVVSVTLGWVSHQMKGFVTDESAGIDTHALTWASGAGVVLMVLGLVLMLRRYHWIHQVVSHGTVIKGVLQKIDVHTTRLPAEKHAPWTPRLSHTYYAVVSYDCGGVTRQARLKLPAGATMTEGAEIDLMILPRTPSQPLLRAVFQNWARTAARSGR